MNEKQPKEEIKKYNKLLVELVNLSVNGLEEMYLPEQYEFALKKKKLGDKVILEGTNRRYTLINLIGLHKASLHNFNSKINLKDVLNKQLNIAERYNQVGDLGLLLWGTSLISPNEIGQILTKVNFSTILENYQDAKHCLTMEMSWLLTGLLMASTFNNDLKNTIGTLPQKVYLKIRNNYGGVGIFRHEAKVSFNGKLRGHIGSFADQVYPIYAFALYAKQMHSEEALLISKECATKICNHQGENGEWYWHYNSKNGKVASKYPIYSVHQDAMAPFALYAIQKASNTNFEPSILKGLDWLKDNNILSTNMIDSENNAVWRAIKPLNIIRKFKSGLQLLGISPSQDYKNLEILKECWSYHLGWILFAFSGRVNKKTENTNSGDSELTNLKLYNFN